MNRLFIVFMFLFICLYMVQQRIEVQNTFSVASVIEDETVLTVATFNIRGARDDDGYASTLVVAEELSSLGADIIALQEVDNGLPRSSFANQIREIAEHLQMNYAYAPSLNLLVGTYGQAVLSRLPIVSAEAVALPFVTERRSLLEVTVDWNGIPFHVYAVHLGLDEAERWEQLALLHQLLQQKSGNSGVLLGDFNTTPDDLSLKPIQTLFIDPLYEQAEPFITLRSNRVRGEIDRILHSPDLVFRSASVPLVGRSDHFPLVMELERPNGHAKRITAIQHWNTEHQ